MNSWKKYMKKIVVSLLLTAVSFADMGIASCQQETAAGTVELNQQSNMLNAADTKHAVSDTAYITLYWLASAGNDKAKLILEHADKELLAGLGKANDFDRIKVVNKEYQKLRYDSLNRYVLDNNYREVMDLACGYSPRGLELSESEITYIGGDFPSVVKDMQSLTDSCAAAYQKKYLKYKAADVTNREQMLAAAADIKGPVCIMTEGLFMYLDKEQAEEAIKNIGEILKNKGGCFITQDFSTKQFVTGVAEALYPHSGEELYKISAGIYNATSDGIMNTAFGTNPAEIKAAIKKAGLHFRKIPLNGKNKWSSAEGLDVEQVKRLNKAMSKKYMWVITASDNS